MGGREEGWSANCIFFFIPSFLLLLSTRLTKEGTPAAELAKLDPHSYRVTAMFLQVSAQPLLWVGLASGHLLIYDTTTCALVMITRRHINAIRSIQSMRVMGKGGRGGEEEREEERVEGYHVPTVLQPMRDQ